MRLGIAVGIGLVIASCQPAGRPPSGPSKRSTAIDPASAPAPAPAPHRRPLPVLAAMFGAPNEETGKLERRARLPRVQGQRFGWRIKVRCTGPVKFRELMKLPSAGDWSETTDLPGTTISEDATTTTTVDYAACKAGWVEHLWVVAENDPAGTYVITVELDGHATQTFRPRFVEPTE
ncbi:MAG: hypothetical protein H0T89_12385 [Deltaproteobacteria bacterium]|nr:hypothetical protein [Deltaproteobacteria bacterium]